MSNMEYNQKATTPKLKEYFVKYIITEVQEERLKKLADRAGTTPEEYFRFLIRLDALEEVEKLLEIAERGAGTFDMDECLEYPKRGDRKQ